MPSARALVRCAVTPNPGSHHGYVIIIIVANMAVAHAVAPAIPPRQPPPRGADRCQHGVPRRHLLVVDAWCRLVTRTSTCSSSATPRYRLVGTQSSPAWRRRATGARRSHPRSRTAAACRGWPKTPWQSTRRRRLAVAPRWWWWWWWCVETFPSRPARSRRASVGVNRAGRNSWTIASSNNAQPRCPPCRPHTIDLTQRRTPRF